MKQTSDEVCFTILFLIFLPLQREGGTGETGELDQESGLIVDPAKTVGVTEGYIWCQ